MKIKRKAIVIGVIVGVLAIVGVAFAYWTQGGSGTGSASNGTTSAITVNQTSVVSGMYPGGPAVALSGNFDNPNPSAVQFSSLTAVVRPFSSQLVDVTKPNCTQADFAIGGTSGANAVPSGSAVGTWSGLTVRMLDNGLNQDNCKSVTVAIDYTATP